MNGAEWGVVGTLAVALASFLGAWVQSKTSKFAAETQSKVDRDVSRDRRWSDSFATLVTGLQQDNKELRARVDLLEEKLHQSDLHCAEKLAHAKAELDGLYNRIADMAQEIHHLRTINSPIALDEAARRWWAQFQKGQDQTMQDTQKPENST